MFDIGGMEVLVIGVVALIVVGPKDLPRLLKTVGGFVRKIREMANEFKAGIDTLASEVEREVSREVDPFADLRREEGLRPGMSPEEVTKHIMANREREEAEARADTADAQVDEPADTAEGAEMPNPEKGGPEKGGPEKGGEGASS